MIEQNILVVEDEEDIQELIAYNLRKEAFKVNEVSSGEEAISFVQNNLPDLIILDLMLPGIDGFEVCKQLKHNQQTEKIPVIMLTAKGEEEDIVAGLELGADDYITKPFSPKILIARIHAVLRREPRRQEAEPDIIKHKGLTIDPGRHLVYVDNKPIHLTVTEFRILHYLAGKPGWVFTRDQIVNAIHETDFAVTTRSIDVQIVALRKKLGNSGSFIETVRGVGYRFREIL